MHSSSVVLAVPCLAVPVLAVYHCFYGCGRYVLLCMRVFWSQTHSPCFFRFAAPVDPNNDRLEVWDMDVAGEKQYLTAIRAERVSEFARMLMRFLNLDRVISIPSLRRNPRDKSAIEGGRKVCTAICGSTTVCNTPYSAKPSG